MVENKGAKLKDCRSPYPLPLDTCKPNCSVSSVSILIEAMKECRHQTISSQQTS